MINEIEEIVMDYNFELTPSNVSRNEKYFSLDPQVLVPSEIARDIIFQKLGENGTINLII